MKRGVSRKMRRSATPPSVFAAAALGEPLRATSGVGGALILAGAALVMRPSRSPRPDTRADRPSLS